MKITQNIEDSVNLLCIINTIVCNYVTEIDLVSQTDTANGTIIGAQFDIILQTVSKAIYLYLSPT